jgi:hypothetical protein
MKGKITKALSKPISQRIEEYLWDHIPTTVVISKGGSAQAGFGGEFGEGFEESDAYNLYSGESAHLYSEGTFEYMGTPTAVSGESHIGISLYYGATTMDSLLGYSDYQGYSISSDGLGKLIYTESSGVSINPDGTPFIDSQSHRQVKYGEITIGRGINAFPNGVDIGAFGGKTFTEYWNSPTLPWWTSQFKIE